MQFPLSIRTVLSIAVIAAVGQFSYTTFAPRGVAARAQQLDEYTVAIHAYPGVPLPQGLVDGDRFDVRKQSLETRVAFLIQIHPIGYVVEAVIDRDDETLTVPVSVIAFGDLTGPGQPGRIGLDGFLSLGTAVLLGCIAILLLWRGRDRAAFGMALWAVTFLFSVAAGFVPSTGLGSLAAQYFGIACFLVARIGFYMMIRARLLQVLKPSQLAVFQTAFVVLLAMGAIQAIGAQLVRLITGSPEFLAPQFGLILSASYLVPIAMLFTAHRMAPAGERLRIRWMLASGLAWVASILLQNTPLFGDAVSNALSQVFQVLSLLGFLYSVLKLRIVDISVVIDRALVYGLVTSLVVGVVAAVNSLVLRETLTPGAGLALQVLVPLSLGIALGKVRSYADFLVERVFFREKYLSESALRTFCRHAGQFGDASKLLDATVRQLSMHMNAPAVAIYIEDSAGYSQVRVAGLNAFPQRIGYDDAAMVAMRAEEKAVDIAGIGSELGSNACVFPMLVFGSLYGVIVCADRPGEHFPEYEMSLVTEVAQVVGAARRILLTKDNDAYVREMASGALTLTVAKQRARRLVGL